MPWDSYSMGNGIKTKRAAVEPTAARRLCRESVLSQEAERTVKPTALTPCPSPEGREENGKTVLATALTPCPSPRAPCTHGRGRGELESCRLFEEAGQ